MDLPLRDLQNRNEILCAVQLLSEKIAYRMRALGVQGKTISLTLRDNNLAFMGHSTTLNEYTNAPTQITQIAMQLFDKFWNNTNLAIRGVRVAVSNFTNANTKQQITFFDDQKTKKLKKFNQVCDKIRDKYGYYAIRNANTIDKDFLNYFDADKEQNEEIY
ncbi:MAG: hypothetical protein IJU58_02190 [Clostridia bacterium]|nr:hypothetical protein [Clostridia bacterium]